MKLIYLSSAWIAGIYLGSKLPLPSSLLGIALLCLLLLTLLCLRRQRRLFWLGLCLVLLLGGMLRYWSIIPPLDEHSLQFYNDRGRVEVRGVVEDNPEVRDVAVYLRLSTREIKLQGKSKEVSGTVLVRLPRLPEYNYGDLLTVNGELQMPSEQATPGYRAYLKQQGINSVMYYPRVEQVKTGEGFKPLAWLHGVRNRLAQALAMALPEPQGSIAQGILLGLRASIPRDLSQAFYQTGTTHILAISGLNISIIAGMVLSLGIALFGRRNSFYLSFTLGILWLYALLAGMNPPVLRAVIMGSLFVIGEYLGRQRSAATALFFAAAVMVATTPVVLWQVSFQLSFAAMAGLIFVSPLFQEPSRKGVARLLGEGGLASAAGVVTDSFAVSLAAIMATAPLTVYYFGIFSLVGLPATLLALPALPGIIVTTALVGGLGLVAPLLAQVAGWIAWLFLTYLIGVVQFFDSFPITFVEVKTLNALVITGYFLAGVVILWLISQRQRVLQFFRLIFTWWGEQKQGGHFPWKWMVLPLLLVTMVVWLVALTPAPQELRVSFLDVGEGDAIIIQTPGGQKILVDGGPSPQAISLELGKKLPFWDKSLDLVILSHPHSDHLAGLVEVLRRYRVKQVIEPSSTYDSPVVGEWRRLLADNQIKHSWGKAGQTIELGGDMKLDILNPQSTPLQATRSDVDNNAVVLRLSWAKVSFLLTGDIQQEAEWELMSQGVPLKSTVLKVAHHGSSTSTSQEFLAAVDPKVAVISVGKDNNLGHPSPAVVDRLKQALGNRVYLTSEQGTIEFTTDGQRLWVKTER